MGYTGPPYRKIALSSLKDFMSVRNMEEYNMYLLVNYIRSSSHGYSEDRH